jgi:hypothetical protein
MTRLPFSRSVQSGGDLRKNISEGKYTINGYLPESIQNLCRLEKRTDIFTSQSGGIEGLYKKMRRVYSLTRP